MLAIVGDSYRFGDRQAAVPDIEVDRRVKLREGELVDDIRADDAELGGAMGHKGRHVERAHADDADVGAVGRETQRSRGLVKERILRRDANPRQNRHRLVEDASFGNGKDQRSGHARALGCRREKGNRARVESFIAAIFG